MGRFFRRHEAIELRTGDRRPQWGKPTRCPACDGPGYLDRLDLGAGIMRQHCPTCWHEWETLEAETLPV